MAGPQNPLTDARSLDLGEEIFSHLEKEMRARFQKPFDCVPVSQRQFDVQRPTEPALS